MVGALLGLRTSDGWTPVLFATLGAVGGALVGGFAARRARAGKGRRGGFAAMDRTGWSRMMLLSSPLGSWALAEVGITTVGGRLVIAGTCSSCARIECSPDGITVLVSREVVEVVEVVHR